MRYESSSLAYLGELEVPLARWLFGCAHASTLIGHLARWPPPITMQYPCGGGGTIVNLGSLG